MTPLLIYFAKDTFIYRGKYHQVSLDRFSDAIVPAKQIGIHKSPQIQKISQLPL